MAHRHFKTWLSLALFLVSFCLFAQPKSKSQNFSCPELFGALSHLSPQDRLERSKKAYEDFLAEDDPSFYQSKLTRTYDSTLPKEKFPEISDYTEDGYRILNSSLVRPFPRLAATLRWRDKIIEELALLNPFKGWVYSGAGLSNEEFASIRNQFGKNMEFSYFFSTSKEKSEASDFIRKQDLKKDPDRTLVLFSVKSKTGREISAQSVFPNEKEVLFKPGTPFRVTSITRVVDEKVLGKTPFWKIELEEKEESPVEIRAVQNPIDYTFQKAIDLKRFGAFGPWLNSGEYQDWRRAYETYVQAGNQHEISIKTLQDIHKMAMGNAFFSGYERRRVRRDYRSGKLTQANAIQKLLEVDKQKSYTGTDSQELAGKLRDHVLDSFEYEGDLQTEKLERYIPAEEIEGLLANPYFRIETDSLEKLEEGKYKARFHYVPPKFVEAETEKIIKNAATRLRLAKDNESYVRATLILHRDLITIHPFLDGNGRTLRLFMDMILAKKNLPLPLTPFEKEYSSSIDDILKQTANEMNKWQIEKVEASEQKAANQ